MIELLSPAGSPEAVIAAVQNGADAVYLGMGDFNARRNARNFTEEEFEKAVRYCRLRGAKVYVTMNTLVSDRELEPAVKAAGLANECGADGIIIQDWGLISVLRKAYPDLPLHASTQMSLHNLAGVEAAAAMGLTRAVLARELSMKQIAFITQHASIETEVFVHGAFCFCHSGQGYMSSVIGQRSGNRGMCAQPCRLQYSLGGRMDDYPLSLKDNCLIKYVGQLEEAGVASLKIEGRMKRPEYTAITTSLYAKAIRGEEITEDDMQLLETTFSRQGFTQGYFTGDKKDMHGIRTEANPDRDTEKMFTAVRKQYAEGEVRRVPVHFATVAKRGEPIRAIAYDDDGNKAVASGPVPERAKRTGITEGFVAEQMYKTGGTPYTCKENRVMVEEGLYLPAADINELRRKLITELSNKREKPPVRRSLPIPPAPQAQAAPRKPAMIFQVRTLEQLTEELAALKPDYIYVPVLEIGEGLKNLDAFMAALKPFVENGATPVAVLPRIITDGALKDIYDKLEALFSRGINEVLAGNIGHVFLAQQTGMKVRGDFGMNVFNAYALGVMKDAGFLSATASFELRIAQIRSMTKCMDTEIIIYGRLPLMVSDQCVIKHSAGRCLQGKCAMPVEMSDRTGKVFPVVREYGCRNVIYNAHKLYMADKQEDLYACNVWGFRAMFTTESPRECVAVARNLMGESDYRPNMLTRGLYYRGVE